LLLCKSVARLDPTTRSEPAGVNVQQAACTKPPLLLTDGWVACRQVIDGVR